MIGYDQDQINKPTHPQDIENEVNIAIKIKVTTQANFEITFYNGLLFIMSSATPYSLLPTPWITMTMTTKIMIIIKIVYKL
jgi:hypothetical protein